MSVSGAPRPVIACPQATTGTPDQENQPQWHDDCVALTVLLSATYGAKGMKKLLKKFGLWDGAQQGPAGGRVDAMLRALHAACHHNRDLTSAVTKDLNTRFRSALLRTKGMTPGALAQEAEKMPWAVPLVWACYHHPDIEARALGSRLAHGLVARGMEHLSAKRAPAPGPERLGKLERANHEMSRRIQRLQTKLDAMRNQSAKPRTAPNPVQAHSLAQARVRQLERALKEEQRRNQDMTRRLERQAAALAEAQAAAYCPQGMERDRDCASQCPDAATGPPHLGDGQAPCGCDGPHAKDCPRRASCPLGGKKVAVIGGLDRLGNKYCHVVDTLGGEGIYHTGKVGGRPARLRSMVGKADLVVFITSINSHNAMSVVKEECRRCRKRLCILRQSGASSLQDLLEGLAA